MAGIWSFGQTTYYISATGSDAAAGTSEGAAWQSISKVNSSTFAAFDTVKFKKGDVFYGGLIAQRNHLNYRAYGTGDRPVISGFTTVSSLTNAGGNKWGTTISDADFRLNIVTLNDTIQRIGRWPNFDSTGLNQGWARFRNGLGTNPDSTTIVGAVFGVNYPNPTDTLTPKHMVLKNQFYRMINTITTYHGHDTINYKRAWGMTSGGSNTIERQPNGGRGYYFTRDSSYLDQRGEYYLDSVTKRFLIYLPGGLGSNVLKVSTVDTAVNVGLRSDISIDGLAFEGFNLYGIFAESGNRVTVNNCSIRQTSAGMSIVNNSNPILTNNVIADNLQTGIRVRNTSKDTCTITGNTVSRSGLIEGQGSFNQKDYTAISAVVQSGLNCSYNNIDSAGNAGIDFNGDNAIIENNYVSYFALKLMDIGGIYTFNDISLQQNRVIQNNFVKAGYGNYAGTIATNGNRDIAYIYLDGHSDSTLIYNNTCWGVDTFNAGYAYQSNQGRGVTFRSNKAHDIAVISLALGKQDTTATSIQSKGNLFYQFTTTYTGSSQRFQLSYTDVNLNGLTMLQSIQRSLNSDSNYYNKASLQNFVASIGVSDTKRTLFNWQVYTITQDQHSTSLTDYGRDSALLFTNPTDKVVNKSISFSAKNPLNTTITYLGTFAMQPYTSLLLLPSGAVPPPATNGIPTFKIPAQKN